MDSNILVETGLEDGERLIRQLIRGGEFEVTVAFWVRINEEGSWHFFVASRCVRINQVNGSLPLVYAALAKIPDSSVSPMDLTLLTDTDPITLDAVALRDRYVQNEPKRFHGKRLGNMATEELWIYPRRLPWKVRQLPDGVWQVLVSGRDDVWLTCDSEEDAMAIAVAPVLEFEALGKLKSGEPFASELEKTADALAKYRMSFGARFLKRRADEVRN